MLDKEVATVRSTESLPLSNPRSPVAEKRSTLLCKHDGCLSAFAVPSDRVQHERFLVVSVPWRTGKTVNGIVLATTMTIASW
jgi:hypothetical protein